jgi:hypothetical protein
MAKKAAPAVRFGLIGSVGVDLGFITGLARGREEGVVPAFPIQEKLRGEAGETENTLAAPEHPCPVTCYALLRKDLYDSFMYFSLCRPR